MRSFPWLHQGFKFKQSLNQIYNSYFTTPKDVWKILFTLHYSKHCIAMLDFDTKNKKDWAFQKRSKLNFVAGGSESAGNIFCGVHEQGHYRSLKPNDLLEV